MGVVSEALLTENENPTEFPTPPVSAPWSGIAKIAERLNVKPIKAEDAKGTITINHEGKAYDLWEIGNALLDRLDEIEERII